MGVSDNGEFTVQNRYREKGSGNGTPRLFEDQSYIRAIDGWKESVNGTTMTYMQYEKAATGIRNNEYAVPIEPGTMNVLWAIGNTVLAANDTPSNHGSCENCRGLDSMDFGVMYLDNAQGIAWYSYVLMGLALILVFFIGMGCGYYFFKNRCLDKAKYASLSQIRDKDSSIQKAVLLEEAE